MISYEQIHCLDANKIWYRKLEFYYQPPKDYYKWRIYHFWDMHFLPFHRTVERVLNFWHDRRCGKSIMECHHMPHTCNQDCKCHYLSIKNRKVLFEVDITEEQGELLK